MRARIALISLMALIAPATPAGAIRGGEPDSTHPSVGLVRFTRVADGPQNTGTAACAGGRVSVQVKAGPRTISTRQARLDHSCAFRSTVDFRQRKRFGRAAALAVTVRFSGTALLARKTARVRRVRLR